MAIGAVSATNTTAPSQLGIQDFLKVLLTQLTYQDPLKPMDNQEFMAQLAQFSTLEQTQQLSTKLDSALGNQAATQSIGLLGRTVTLNAASGSTQGQVSAIDFSTGSPSLTLTLAGGTSISGISMGQILSVR